MRVKRLTAKSAAHVHERPIFTSRYTDNGGKNISGINEIGLLRRQKADKPFQYRGPET